AAERHDHHLVDLPEHGNLPHGGHDLLHYELHLVAHRALARTAHDASLPSSAIDGGPPSGREGSRVMSIVKVRGLKKHFGQNQVLKGVDLSIEPGEVTFRIGPSGGGKTTLLRCLNFLEMPDGGTIEIEGKKLCEEDEKGFRRAPDKELRQA